MAAAGPIRLPNGQLIGQPGSNGGVHRGPDLGIRRNVMAGLFMRAMIRDGVLIVVDAKGKLKPPKNGVNGNGHPVPATFHRPPRAERPAEAEPPTPPPEPGTLIGPDGKEYVSG